MRILDNLSTGDPCNLAGFKHLLIQGCVTDQYKVRSAIDRAECIFHLAALVGVSDSIANPSECNRINVEGLLQVLEAAVSNGVRKFIFASSASVYGDDPRVPKLENMPLAPESPYACSKLEGEQLLDLFQSKHGLETVAFRFFNVFGPGQDARGPYPAVIPSFIRSALKNEDILVNGDGEQTRDFIYVKDVVEALAFAATTSNMTGVFNVGYGIAMTINELVAKIIWLTGSSSRIVHLPPRFGDVRHSYANVDKLRAAGWIPRHTFDEALAATVDYYREP